MSTHCSGQASRRKKTLLKSGSIITRQHFVPIWYKLLCCSYVLSIVNYANPPGRYRHIVTLSPNVMIPQPTEEMFQNVLTILTYCCLVTPYGDIKISELCVSGNGLLMTLPVPLLTYHQCSFKAFNWEFSISIHKISLDITSKYFYLSQG